MTKAKPLNALYGRGASTAFSAAVGGRVSEVAIDEGVRCYVTWPNGSEMKIDCYPDRVHFLALTSKRRGLYTDLCKVLPDLFRERGVKRFTALAGSDDSDGILRKRGKWRAGDRGLEWEL